MENDWKVMRWQSAMIVNMMSKSKVTPEQLFTLGDEVQVAKIDPNSEEAQRVFDKMAEVYNRKRNRNNG